MNHYSIGNMIALLVSCEDRSGEYRHEGVKQQLFKQILEYGFTNIENSSNFDGFLATVEEIMNSTKQFYYEYFEDFKRCVSILVSEETLKKFVEKLDKNEISFKNSSSYLDIVLKRINSESEEQDYYRDQESSSQGMKFEHEFLFQQLNFFLNLLETVP